jgi:hypothetical protein
MKRREFRAIQRAVQGGSGNVARLASVRMACDSIVTDTASRNFSDRSTIIPKPTIAEEVNDGPTYELFQAGRHQVIHGDSTDLMFISGIIEEMDVNLIIYDPPYQIEDAYVHIPNMDGNLVQLLAFWDCKRAGAAHIAANQAGWPFFSEIIWDNGQVNFRQDHEIDWAHKTCGIFGNVKWSSSCATQFMPLKEKRGMFTQNKKFSSIYKEKKTAVKRHRHAKPDHWIQSIISGAGGFANRRIALDMFGGGGSTLLAMEKVGGTAIVIEKDYSTFNKIKKMWFEHNTEMIGNQTSPGKGRGGT